MLECALIVGYCNHAVKIGLSFPPVCAALHLYTIVCVCVLLCPASSKQRGLSGGRSRLKVPGEDVILSDAAHRDRQPTRDSLTLCLIDLNTEDIKMNCRGFIAAFPSYNYHPGNASIGVQG